MISRAPLRRWRIYFMRTGQAFEVTARTFGNAVHIAARFGGVHLQTTHETGGWDGVSGSVINGTA